MDITSRRFRLRAVWLLVLPFYWFAAPTPALLAVGGAVAAVGVAIRAWAAGHLRKEQVLTVTGPYAYVRNPLYVGTLFIGLGVTVAGGRPLFLFLFAAFYLLVYRGTAFKEEGELERVFGASFRRYAADVPLFVPRLTPYGPAEAVAEPPDDAPGAASPPLTFTAERYLANREWEAGTGVAVAFLLLALKMWMGW